MPIGGDEAGGLRDGSPRAFKDQFRTAQGSNSTASAEREPITGVWGRSSQQGSREQSPRWGIGGGGCVGLELHTKKPCNGILIRTYMCALLKGVTSSMHPPCLFLRKVK